MTTATHPRQADMSGVAHVGSATASRGQVALARVLVAVLAAGTIAGALALGRDDHPAAGRFAVPHVNDAPAVKGTFGDAQVVKGARGGAFGDPQVIKGARGGAFNDPVVRKGAAGAPLR